MTQEPFLIGFPVNTVIHPSLYVQWFTQSNHAVELSYRLIKIFFSGCLAGSSDLTSIWFQPTTCWNYYIITFSSGAQTSTTTMHDITHKDAYRNEKKTQRRIEIKRKAKTPSSIAGAIYLLDGLVIMEKPTTTSRYIRNDHKAHTRTHHLNYIMIGKTKI